MGFFSIRTRDLWSTLISVFEEPAGGLLVIAVTVVGLLARVGMGECDLAATGGFSKRSRSCDVPADALLPSALASAP